MSSGLTHPENRLVTRNPITGEVMGEFPILEARQVRELVASARAAQAAWARRRPAARVAVLDRLRALIAGRADEVAELIRGETGKTMGEALTEVVFACDYLAYLRGVAPGLLRPRRAGTGWLRHRRARVTYEPYGVVAVITPWNYPFAIEVSGVATALAAGNAVVLKPSEYTPATGRLLADLVAEVTGRPELVQLATGDGRTGAALVEAGVDKIAFTGSAATGAKVMSAAAKSLTPVVLELGGKDAMIVCGDADVERAARGAVWAAFYGCGQVCMSVERVYVVADVYDEFVQAALSEARRVRTSDEPEAMIGSLIAPFQLEKVRRQVEDARTRGARIHLGGRTIEAPGHFFQPTLMTGVDHGMEVMREETFGPILPIMRVADEEEAVDLANDSDYGLDASVWTADRERGRHIAQRLNAGSVLINDHLINYTIPDLPFGGTRRSGFGRVHGVEGLREFVQPRAWVEDRVRLGREPYWFREGESGERLVRSLLAYRHGRSRRARLAGALRLLRNLKP